MRPFLLTLALVLALAPAAASADDRVVDRLSFGPDGGNGAVSASVAGISDDGSCVAFATAEPLIASAGGGVYERCAGGVGRIGSGGFVALDADGDCALFSADKLCRGTLMPVTAGTRASLSADGACVTLLTGGRIVRDCDTESTGRLTSDLQTGVSELGGASEDGACVAFTTTASLVASDRDATADVYRLCDGSGPAQMSKTGTPIDLPDPDGPTVPGENGAPDTNTAQDPPPEDPAIDAGVDAISGNGSCVVFHTAEQLDASDPLDTDRMGTSRLWMTCGSGTPQTATPATGVTFEAVNETGGCVTYTAAGQILRSCAPSFATGSIVSAGAGAQFLGQADDGSAVTWSTPAKVTSDDGDDQVDVYQRTGTDVVRVSRGRGDAGNGPFWALTAAVSGDGRIVAFGSPEELVQADEDGVFDDVYALHAAPELFPDPPPQAPPDQGSGGTGGGGGGGAFGGGALGAGTAGNATFTITGLVPAGTLTQTNRSAADRQAPRLFGLALEPATLRLRQTGTLRFALSEPATVTVTVERRRDGRLRGKRCVTTGRYARGKGSRKARKAKRCVRWVRTGRPVSGDADDGLTRLSFRPNALVPGRYRIVAGARDGAGNATPKPRTAGFKVRR